MKTVIFDMDGTLLDSSRAIEISVNNTRRELYGLAPLQKNFIVHTINDPSKNAFLEFYGKTEASAEELAFFEKEFVSNYRDFAVLYEGIEDLLHSCKKAGFFLAVASNAPSYTLSAILEKTGVRRLFDLVVGANEQMPSKPNPAMLLHVIARSPHKNAIFLGDSKKDELAAIRGAEFLQNLEFQGGNDGESLNASRDTSRKNFSASEGLSSCGENLNADEKFRPNDTGADGAATLSFKGAKISAKAEATESAQAAVARCFQANLADLRGAKLEYLQVCWGFGEPSELSRNALNITQAREIIGGI
ncbi:HAD family hydrolase [uncultured Campylobacter sp.]|uniref:HAD family hydrolase n=1 Tax=uncultured Campylobacter sp. TaxID=218934 RepID=UPI0026380B93|nr:HAD family hydrolase [uncultured Campylobacter sp.]